MLGLFPGFVDRVCQDEPAKFALLDEDEKVVATVEIEARYVPVPVTLEARESVNSRYLLY